MTKFSAALSSSMLYGMAQYNNTLIGLTTNGFSILNNFYTKNEVQKIRKVLQDYFHQSAEPTFGKRKLLKDIPGLKPLLFNAHLTHLIQSIDPKAFLTKAIYFDKPVDSNWYVTWHQDIPINVVKKIETEGFKAWTKKQDVVSVCPPEEILKNSFTLRIHLDATTIENGALKVLPGAHTKLFTVAEKGKITSKLEPAIVEVGEGGIQLMKPLLLHSSSKSQNNKRRRVIHLEFCSLELPNGLEWLEREAIF
jgi:hypothetical protein